MLQRLPGFYIEVAIGLLEENTITTHYGNANPMNIGRALKASKLSV